jgi:hypothetical protein
MLAPNARSGTDFGHGAAEKMTGGKVHRVIARGSRILCSRLRYDSSTPLFDTFEEVGAMLEGNSDVTIRDLLSILTNYPSHLLQSVKDWLDSICRKKQRPLHVQKSVMRVAIRLHSAFGR